MKTYRWLLCLFLMLISTNAKSQEIQTVRYAFHKVAVYDSESFKLKETKDVTGYFAFSKQGGVQGIFLILGGEVITQMRVVQVLEDKSESDVYSEIFRGGFISDEGDVIGAGRIVKMFDLKKNKSVPEGIMYSVDDSDIIMIFEGIILLNQ